MSNPTFQGYIYDSLNLKYEEVEKFDWNVTITNAMCIKLEETCREIDQCESTRNGPACGRRFEKV